MRSIAPAVAVTVFALSAPAFAAINAPDGSCVLFCNPAPTPAPSATPDPTPSTAAAAPLTPHHHHAAAVASAKPEHKHLWKQIHPGKAASLRSHRQAAAIATPSPVPTPPVAPVLRTPAPQPVAPVLRTPAPQPSVAVTPPVTRAPSAPAPVASPAPAVDTGAAEAQRLLAHALTERAQMTPAPVPSVAPSVQPQPAPSPAPSAIAATPLARNLGIVQFTADGVVVPWWPGNFVGRFAIWLAATALIAASGFGLSRTGGRRLVA